MGILNDTKPTFSDIIRGIQYAVGTANQVAEKQYSMILDTFFKKEGDNYKPIMAWFDSGSGPLQVPLITLVNYNPLLVKKLTVSMKVKVDDALVKQYNEDPTRACFNVRLSGLDSLNMMDVMIEFEQAETPEGISRIIEDLGNKIKSV